MFPLFNTTVIGLLLCVTPALASTKDRVTFQWSDINTREVIEWKGDTAVVQKGAVAKKLDCNFLIDQKTVDIAIEKFGIPYAWTSLSYKDNRDLFRQQLELQNKAKVHGIKLIPETNSFTVDYDWVIKNSEQEVKDIARAIRRSARHKGYRSRESLIGAFASFVQSLEYRIPLDHRFDKDGQKILTAGVMMPIDTINRRWGDCDSKSMLFASLVQSINLVKVCFIELDDHLFVGVQIPAKAGTHTIRHKGRTWTLIELTDAWPIGRIPTNHLTSIMNGQYKVAELH